jgi:hypothetical protein
MIELIDNKSHFWQGWNDFLGTKNEDTHNYIINLIGDIIDGYKVAGKVKELGERLLSDKSDSYLFHSEYVYKCINSNGGQWLQVLLYKVDEHFIFIMYCHKAIIWCEYVGTDLAFAIEKFKKYHNDGHLLLLMTNKSDLILIKKSISRKVYPDLYILGDYQVYIYDDEYFDSLRDFLSSSEEIKNSIC